MKRTKLVTATVLVLLVASPVLGVTLIQESHSDGPTQTSEWSNSTYSGGLAQPNYDGGTSEIRLELNDVSDSQGSFSDALSSGDDTTETTSDVHLKRGSSEGDRSQGGDSVSDSRTVPASAFYNDRVWYLGDYLHQTSPSGGSSIRQCDIASNIPGQPRGLATHPDGGKYDLIITGRDTFVSTTNVYEYDVDNCEKNKLFSRGAGGSNNRGAAVHDSKVYVISGSAGAGDDVIDTSELSTGNAAGEVDIPDGAPRGLDIKEWPDGTVWLFVSYTGEDGEEELQIIRESDEKVIKTFTSTNGDTYTAAWHHGEKKVFTVDGNNDIEKITPVNLWKGDGEAKVKYKDTLSQDPSITDHDVKSISWDGEAPSAYKDSGGTIKLQVKDLNGNWQTVDSYTAGTGSFSNTVTLDANFHGLEQLTYRVVFTDNYKIRGSSSNPKVTDVSWNYDYYSSSGRIESDSLNADGVQGFQNVTLNGTPGGENVDVVLLDSDGNVEYQNQDVAPNATLNLSSVPTDYSTQQVSLRFTMESSGLQSPGVTGWQLNYERAPETPPKIEETHATIGGENTTSDNVYSAIRSNDSFYVDEVNEPIDQVTWYVDGENQATRNVSGTGPFAFNYTWEETGVRTVTAEVLNESTGRLSSTTWNVTVYDILIGGRNAFSESPGNVFEFEQRFEVFEVSGEKIEFEVSWNASIVKRISGPTGGNVSFGDSRIWKFQALEGDYEGYPITITASYGDKTAEKQLFLTTTSSGAIYGGGDDSGEGSVLTNTWIRWVIDDLTTQTSLIIQAAFTVVWATILWLHHFGLVWLPGPISRVLDRRPTGSKGAFTVIVGTLTLGLGILPWIGLTVLVGYLWLRLVKNTRLKELVLG